MEIDNNISQQQSQSQSSSSSSLSQEDEPITLQNALAGLNLQIGNGEQSSGDINTELLTGAATTVVSFVFVNRQATLFNLLIQMLSTNKFTPVILDRSSSFSNIPFQGSPNPSLSESQSKQQLQQLQSQSPPQSQQQQHKGSQMFYVLQEAINVVSKQYNTNFYIHILESAKKMALFDPNHQPQSSSSPSSSTSSLTSSTLPKTNDSLLSGCLSFINHMMSSAPTQFDFERYRQLLSSQGVNDAIKKYIKNVDPNVRLELLHYQQHKLTNIKLGKHITDKQSIDHLLARLIKISFPGQSFNPGDDSMTEKLKSLGFEGDTHNDHYVLLGTGILGLRNLIYFGARYSRIYQEILSVQLSRTQEEAQYSFAQVGMSLTNVIYEIYIDDENIYEIIFDQDDWFEELFSISFELFDEIWEREAKKPEDFLTILHKTRTILSRIKWTNPDSIHGFQVTLGSVLDEIFTSPEHPDMEDEVRPTVGLSDSILGLPTGNYSTHHNNTYRFQKFLNERLDKFKTIGRKDSTGSSSAITSSGGIDDETSSNHSAPPDSPKHLRNQSKSMSFKKLFDFKSSKESNGDEVSNTKQMDEETSSNSSFSFSRKGTLKKKEATQALNESQVIENSDYPSSAENINGQHEHANGGVDNKEGGQSKLNVGSLKSSGTAIYKSVKKAMHKIEKKGKNIKQKVKKSIKEGGNNNNGEEETQLDENGNKIEKKKKKSKKHHRHASYVGGNESITASGSAIQNEMPSVDFQPNLDLDFSQGDSSSDSEDEEEDSDEDDSTIAEEGVEINYTESGSDVPPDTPKSNNSTNNNINNPLANTFITISSSQNDLQQQQQQHNVPILTTTTTTTNTNNNTNNGNIVKSSPSTDSLSSASHFHIRQQQKQQQGQQLSLSSGYTDSTNNSNNNNSAEISPRVDMTNIKASTSTGDIHSLAGTGDSPSLSKRRSIYGSNDFVKGPFGTIERRKSPSNPVVKSTSIKTLVNFFETTHSGPPPPVIQRQKSFRSDKSTNTNNNNNQ